MAEICNFQWRKVVFLWTFRTKSLFSLSLSLNGWKRVETEYLRGNLEQKVILADAADSLRCPRWVNLDRNSDAMGPSYYFSDVPVLFVFNKLSKELTKSYQVLLFCSNWSNWSHCHCDDGTHSSACELVARRTTHNRYEAPSSRTRGYREANCTSSAPFCSFSLIILLVVLE